MVFVINIDGFDYSVIKYGFFFLKSFFGSSNLGFGIFDLDFNFSVSIFFGVGDVNFGIIGLVKLF